MGVLVKICGINTPVAADAAARAGADVAGLVFHAASPRFVTADAARALAARLRGKLKLAALLVDAGDAAIAAAIEAAGPDFLQLHGQETPERVGAIRARFGIPVIKCFAVATAEDLSRVAAYDDAADMFLFDAKAPANADRPGGHGASFDWQLLRGQSFARPWLLAGGLTAENVARAIAATGAPGVDVSSGVESAVAVKSPQMIAGFVAAARSAQFAEAPR